MIKILFVSENVNQTRKFDGIFNNTTYDYYNLTDESVITELITRDTPDIIIVDQDYENLKTLNKTIKLNCSDSIVIYLIPKDKVDKELIKYANSFITYNMSEDLIVSTININLRMKNTHEMLSSFLLFRMSSLPSQL